MNRPRIITALKRSVIGLLAVAAIMGGIALLPGTIEGSYRGMATPCMCDSVNFLRIYDGKLIMYRSNHPPADLVGRYDKNLDGSISGYMYPGREGEAEIQWFRATPHKLVSGIEVAVTGLAEWYRKSPERGKIRATIDAQEIVWTNTRRDGLIEYTFYDAGFKLLRKETKSPRVCKAEDAQDRPPTAQ